MTTLRQEAIRRYIADNYPNSQIVAYDDADSGLTFYTEEALADLRTDWFPLSCHKDADTGRMVFGGRSNVAHTYTEGETGAGKTTRFVMQSIRALSDMASKPSFLVVDIHGEIVENLYTHLRQQGYEVRILNCDDPAHSDTFNPFQCLIRSCLDTGSLSNEGYNMIRKLAELMQPVNSTQDPIWDQGARSYTNGAILDKFEDLMAGQIPAECITLYNIIENHYWLRGKLGGFGSGLRSIEHYGKKPQSALSVQKMMSVTDNAEKTRASYFGVVENHYDAFGQPSLYQLSSNSTVDIEQFLEQPTAIIIQSGNTNVGDHLISLMVNEIYSAVVRKGRALAGKKLPRPIHCFLDEFANCNIAAGDEFIKMLTTSRKFGMHWHLLLQCDAQLDRKYDKNIARIIRANCTEIFMGSQDYETMQRFARSCGQKTVESLESMILQQMPALEVTDLMTVDRLNLMQEGVMYIKSSRYPLLRSYVEAFYNCEEYQCVTNIDEVYPHNDFDYTQTVFYPTDIPQDMQMEEYMLLQYLHEYGPTHVVALEAVLPKTAVRPALRKLQRQEYVVVEDNMVRLTMKEGTYRLMKRPEEELTESDGVTDGASEDHNTPVMPELVDPLDASIAGLDLVSYDDYFVLPIALPDMTTQLVQLNMVPEDMVQLLCRYASERSLGNGRSTPESTDRRMVFEILEAFIGSNEFYSKQEWVDAFEEQLKKLRRLTLFSPRGIRLFEDSLRELRDELTLGNILEIRKIIRGSE